MSRNDDDDDDDEGLERVLGWLLLALVGCVVVLAVVGTAYAVHRILMAW